MLLKNNNFNTPTNFNRFNSFNTFNMFKLNHHSFNNSSSHLRYCQCNCYINTPCSPHESSAMDVTALLWVHDNHHDNYHNNHYNNHHNNICHH